MLSVTSDGVHLCSDITLDIGMLLIDFGADANAQNRFGDAPLIEAVMGNRVECALLLCEGGADPTLSSHFHPEICPFKMQILDLALDLKEVFSHAISRKSVTGSLRLKGKSVTLHGLSRHALNGQQGECGKLDPHKKRYAVTITDDHGNSQQMLIALKNLRVNRGLEGQRVALKGLSKQDLNGRQGLVGIFHEERGRWLVTLDGDSESVAVKPANLEELRHLHACTHCGATATKMSKCQKCFKSRFCSTACVQQGWPAHKAECQRSREGQVTLDPRTCGPPDTPVFHSFSDPSGKRMDISDNPVCVRGSARESARECERVCESARECERV